MRPLMSPAPMSLLTEQHSHSHREQETIHLLHLPTLQAQFHARPGLVTIPLAHQSVGQFPGHQQTDHNQIVRSVLANAHQCQAIVQAQFAQDLLLGQLVQVAHQVPEDQQERHEQAAHQVAHQVRLHIAHRLPHQQVLHLPLVEKVAAAINEAELPAHLVNKAAKKEKLTRARKHFAKSSTIWRHHHWVEQLFHMVMAKQ
jgi:hypothetical protein